MLSRIAALQYWVHVGECRGASIERSPAVPVDGERPDEALDADLDDGPVRPAGTVAQCVTARRARARAAPQPALPAGRRRPRRRGLPRGARPTTYELTNINNIK